MMKMKLISCATCALAMTISGQALAGDITIGTLGDWDGVEAISAFGETNTATYGQTFQAAGDFMTSFTFFINDAVNPDFVDFEAYVYAWDGTKATGPALYASDAMSTTNNGGADGFEQFTIDTGSTAVTNGNTYVAFFSASNLFDGETGTSSWGFINSDVFDGGTFVFMNNGDDFSQLFANTWNTFGVADLAFEATFSDVPAPAALAVFGIAGLSMGRRRRK